MVPSFFDLLSDDIQRVFLLWLDVPSLITLDVAVSSDTLRPCWMMLLQSMKSPAMDDWHHSMASVMWLSRRGIRPSRLQMKEVDEGVRGCDILLLDTSDLVYLGLRGCSNITDQCVIDIVKRCRQLSGIELGDCKKQYCTVTDVGITALATGCGRLQTINIGGCRLVTDAGVTALSHECGQLQSIDLTGCEKVTEAGVRALSAGCGQLRSINLECCYKVTDAGVTALSAGCGQLQRIDLSYCQEVTDAGVTVLSRGCGRLQSINLKYCGKVTNAVFNALGQVNVTRR